MRTILLIVVLSGITQQQYVAARANYEIREQSVALRSSQRGITEIWNNIKNSAKNALESIKNIALNTKAKIKEWIENVKDRARISKVKLEDRINEIREKSKTVLEKLIGTGKLVKECFQKQNESVEELLKQILKYVTSCVSDNLINLVQVDNRALKLYLNLNETIFITNVENKINNCAVREDVEACLHKVRQDIYLAMEDMENEVLTSRTETRGITDDILNAVVSCSVEGLLDGSNVIAEESIQIINCVIES